MNSDFPEQINKWLGSQRPDEDTVGLSMSSVLIYPEYVLKISPSGEESKDEASMMRWLQGKLPVPKVIEFISHDGKDYLLMERLSGEMSCSPGMLRDPDKLVRLLSASLKMWWSIDPKKCPVDQSLNRKLQIAEKNVLSGYASVENVQPNTYGPNGFRSPEHLLDWLKENKPDEDLTVTHGDFCLPNLFFSGDKLTGFLDLSRSGISDKWQDISLCWRSLQDNLNGRYASAPIDELYEDLLFEYLGIEKDEKKLRYYILLDELF